MLAGFAILSVSVFNDGVIVGFGSTSFNEDVLEGFCCDGSLVFAGSCEKGDCCCMSEEGMLVGGGNADMTGLLVKGGYSVVDFVCVSFDLESLEAALNDAICSFLLFGLTLGFFDFAALALVAPDFTLASSKL